jgi:hypothetical protein
MAADGQDVRPEPLEERRKRLGKLLSGKAKAIRDGIQLSEAIRGDGATMFEPPCARVRTWRTRMTTGGSSSGGVTMRKRKKPICPELDALLVTGRGPGARDEDRARRFEAGLDRACGCTVPGGRMCASALAQSPASRRLPS